RIHPPDAVAQRGQVLLQRRAFRHELHVQHHVVQRVLALVRETHGHALEQPRAIGLAPAALLHARNPLNLLRHRTESRCDYALQAMEERWDFPLPDFLSVCWKGYWPS